MIVDSADVLNLVRSAFPIEPVPVQFFWTKGKDALDHDIPQELKNRIAGRLWADVSLMDWRMTGVSPVVSRHYFEPETFMYYVPSLIVGTSHEIEFIYLALEGIIPNNKHHVPRGEWWSEFSGIASPRQRTALSAFLSHVRSVFWDRIGLANQHLLEHAERVWSS